MLNDPQMIYEMNFLIDKAIEFFRTDFREKKIPREPSWEAYNMAAHYILNSDTRYNRYYFNEATACDTSLHFTPDLDTSEIVVRNSYHSKKKYAAFKEFMDTVRNEMMERERRFTFSD